ncbi:hypothetical protein FOPE_04078 [Fonsecaea pedrosoi]|nr:hypothetical protein FOPE_04078 [Fonsecaea pedrosoi]
MAPHDSFTPSKGRCSSRSELGREWRQSLESPPTSIDTEGHASISLRSELCEFLVDVPGLIREATSTADQLLDGDVDPVGLKKRHQNAIIQISSVKHAFEWWYSTKIAPLRSISDAVGSTRVETTSNSSVRDDLLLAVVDCVSNSIMIKLDTLQAQLNSDWGNLRVDVLGCQQAQAKRRKMMYQALQFVRDKSLVAAKPLEFGLRQLWLDTEFEHSEKYAAE